MHTPTHTPTHTPAPAHPSAQHPSAPVILRPHGGYRTLRAHQVATLIYDNTYWFCERYIRRDDSRLRDQMVHAARSGRQNIAEGSRRAATSNTTEIKLTDVARASLEELLNDYEDYLRQHRLPEWDKDSPEALAVRNAHQAAPAHDFRRHYRQSQDALNAHYSRWLETDDPAIRANALICLIHQANYLLDQLLQELGVTFVEDGGFTEHLATLRADHRATANKTAAAAHAAPADAPPCPKCGQPMRRRTAAKGRNAGKPFWGCTAYPTCNGILEITTPAPSPKPAR